MPASLKISRRSFLAAGAARPLALNAAKSKIPIGLELYSVRGELAKDLPAMVTAVAQMGYRVIFGEGVCPWGKIFEAAERVGGVEYYLIEQEGSRYPELETAQRCLDNGKKVRA